LINWLSIDRKCFTGYYYQFLIIANIRISLGKYVERNQIASDSDDLKVWSHEDKNLAGASLHPLEGSELKTSLSHTRICLHWLILTRQNQHAFNISQSRKDFEKEAIRRDRTRTPHMEKVF
jgi:hypothetical protein